MVSGDKSTPATLLTTSKKKIKNIAIFLKDADDSEEEEKENKNNVATEQLGRSVSNTKLRIIGLEILLFRIYIVLKRSGY